MIVEILTAKCDVDKSRRLRRRWDCPLSHFFAKHVALPESFYHIVHFVEPLPLNDFRSRFSGLGDDFLDRGDLDYVIEPLEFFAKGIFRAPTALDGCDGFYGESSKRNTEAEDSDHKEEDAIPHDPGVDQ